METAQVHCERQEQVGAQFLRKHEGPGWPARADPAEFWDPALTLPGLTVDSGHPLWLVPPTPPRSDESAHGTRLGSGARSDAHLLQSFSARRVKRRTFSETPHK